MHCSFVQPANARSPVTGMAHASFLHEVTSGNGATNCSDKEATLGAINRDRFLVIMAGVLK